MIPDRYTVENLRRVLANPRMVLGELTVVTNKLNMRITRRTREPDGMDVVEEDWDNLLILDGCRYDTYEEVLDDGYGDHPELADGELQRRTSPGTESSQFLEESFGGRRLHDTVYVTANPHAPKLDDDVFHAVENVLSTRWDEDLRTVPPEEMVAAARDAAERYPEKRLIVHFMQPHFPFIGETGRRLDQGGIARGSEDGGEYQDVWSRAAYGLEDPDVVERAYRENLELALDAVTDLLPDLGGKTVVTADHGNLLGDRIGPIPSRAFGHPRGLYVPELLTVPWHVLPAAERRTITAEAPKARDAMDDETIENRLKNLGYAD